MVEDRGLPLAAPALLHLLAKLLHAREMVGDRVLDDGLLIGRERVVKIEPCASHLTMRRRCGIPRRVRRGSDRAKIRFCLGKLRRQRVTYLLIIRARGVASRLPRRDCVVPHRLLRGVEVQL